jgi:uncharacterized protein YndB with AHSA1/START domain
MTDSLQNSARASIDVEAAPDEVWEALTSPGLTRLWMAGAEVASDWTPGSTITWSGLWDGQPFEDSGTVLDVDEPHRLSTTHRSGGSAAADTPQDEHVVTYELEPLGGTTRLTVTQEGRSPRGVPEYEKTWTLMLEQLKQVVEDHREHASS